MVYITLLAIVILLLTYMRIEAAILTKSFISFSTDSKGLRIVQLSDIHINKFFISVPKLIAQLRQIEPDIIIMTGDYIEKFKELPKFIRLLTLVTKEFKVYLSFGNHDHQALRSTVKNPASLVEAIEAAGACVLLNKSVTIYKGSSAYNLIGIDDYKRGTPDINKAFEGIVPSLQSGRINIAFSHNPDIVFELPENKVDFLLCGHFHGGQIWMPFRLEFKLMRNERLSKMGYYRGLHKVNGINIYLNRGLGNVLFPFRFFSPPEITVLQLPSEMVHNNLEYRYKELLRPM